MPGGGEALTRTCEIIGPAVSVTSKNPHNGSGGLVPGEGEALTRTCER